MSPRTKSTSRSKTLGEFIYVCPECKRHEVAKVTRVVRSKDTFSFVSRCGHVAKGGRDELIHAPYYYDEFSAETIEAKKAQEEAVE